MSGHSDAQSTWAASYKPALRRPQTVQPDLHTTVLISSLVRSFFLVDTAKFSCLQDDDDKKYHLRSLGQLAQLHSTHLVSLFILRSPDPTDAVFADAFRDLQQRTWL